HLEPLTMVHLYSSLAGFEPNGSITYIYMFAIIALMILIIACANYTNLSTAQSAGRSGEIGMRKVMGASKRQVFLQFIGESSLITFIAAAFAFVLGIMLIPYFNDILCCDKFFCRIVPCIGIVGHTNNGRAKKRVQLYRRQ